tara:strand:- start:314 stop:502 length:189 start_codon:yes stop_codon:yes gene_type:complete
MIMILKVAVPGDPLQEEEMVLASPLYNKSEKIIGLLNNNKFKIISKIPKTPRNIKKKILKNG